MSLLDRKHDFADPDGVTYLNCAYQGPMPKVSLAAARRALDLKARPHTIRDEDYFVVPDAYRTAVAKLIGAKPERVAVADSTTHGMMLLVRGLDWRSGDQVLIPAGEFPANRFPWLSLARHGVEVREIEVPAGSAGLERIEAAMGPRTRLLSIAWVRYQTGERRDLAALGRLCREREVLFAVDGSQGVGGLAFDLGETPCDLLACSGYKWLLGPYGLGFAVLGPALVDRLEPGNVNWFAVQGARDFSRLDRCRLELEPGARRFDVNETANFFNLLPGIESLRYLDEVGVARAENHVRALQDRLVDRLPSGFRLLADPGSPTRSNICCLVGEDEELADRAGHALARRRVEVSRREGTLRISPFVFNTADDLDLLLDGLAEATASGPW